MSESEFMTDRAILEELIEQANIFTRDEGIAIEIYEEVPRGVGGLDHRIRVFEPTPGPEPEESIQEALISLYGETPDGDPLVEIAFGPTDQVYVSLSPAAVAAVLVRHP